MACNFRKNSLSIEPDQRFVLGIDVGTTSVKTCIVDVVSKTIMAMQAKDTQANVPSDRGTEGNKQDVPKICSCVSQCISRLPRDMLKRVVHIGICGQMHGILFWKSGEGWKRNGEKVDPAKTSNLYTWQDSRCSKEFLASLPTPDSHLRLSSGYGCTTLFWMSKHKPEKLEQFDKSGTIQDFIGAMLCELETSVMSVQNAASWGYYNTVKKDWNVDLLKEAGFPVHFLPNVVEAGQCAGKLHKTWHCVPEGTPVLAALGDFQCSVYSTITKSSEASLNISTSCQMAFIEKDNFVPEPLGVPKTTKHIMEYFPYFDGKYLAAAAALTGGNSLAAFVQMLQHWVIDLGLSIPQSKIWEKILAVGSASDKNSVPNIMPILYGERHDPDRTVSASNLSLDTISLGQVTRAICRGIILNLHEMIPASVLKEAGVTSVIGSGSALSRNTILQEEFLDIYKIETSFKKGGDSAYGAALACIRNL